MDRLLNGHSFETTELTFVKSFLKNGGKFLDIGANFGLYSIVAASRVGKEGMVVAIEPDKTNRKRLNRNLLFNGLRNRVRIYPFAICDQNRAIPFLACSQGAFSGILTLDVPGQTSKTNVTARTLDSLQPQIDCQEFDLAKMDIEGAELLALRGGEKFFCQSPRPPIICEISDPRTVPYKYAASEIINQLMKFHYRLFEFAPAGKLIPHNKQTHYLDKNLLACPEEKLHLLETCLIPNVDHGP
jgi:FkbM family methyltransferase